MSQISYGWTRFFMVPTLCLAGYGDMSYNSIFQNWLYVGNNFSWILYGVNFVLYTKTMYIYITQPRDQRSARFFTSFSTASLILITIFVALQSILGEETWIINADYPGGSAAYSQVIESVWWQTMATTCAIALQLLSDGLWIYRCLIVWSDWRIIVVPCFLWLITLAFGIFDLYATGSPNTNFFVGFAVNIGVTYVAVSIGLNVLVTSLICGRILCYAHRLRKQFGSAFAETYFSSAAIIVESALPYALSGIAFVVSYGMQSGVAFFFLLVYTMFMCLSPQMLILRVASGRAWSASTMARTDADTLHFRSVAVTTTTSIVSTVILDDRTKSFAISPDEGNESIV